MLDKVNFEGKSITKESYDSKYDKLIEKLVVKQQDARSQGVGLVVLFEGWNGAGKGSRISDLMYHLDARATSVYVTPPVDDDEIRDFAKGGHGVTEFFPLMQEFWKMLGERGSITFYDRGWYSKAMEILLLRRDVEERNSHLPTRHLIDSIGDFERQLYGDGYMVVKFFVHVSKKAQHKRLTDLYEDKTTRWRVPEKKLTSVKDYDDQYELYDSLLEDTSYDFAPWILVNGEDKRGANITIAETLIDAIERGIARKEEEEQLAKTQLDFEAWCAAVGKDIAKIHEKEQKKATKNAHGTDAAKSKEVELRAEYQHSFAPPYSSFEIKSGYPKVDTIKHNLKLEKKEYKKELKKLQRRFFKLENLMYQARVPLIIMYEGWDAAGKGGNIKRVAQALDARAYNIFPSPAPTKPELAHPHLWRYWTRLPKAGHVGLYDRSWYGRVLVERVEEITPPKRWAQGYDEINAFEQDLLAWGAILLKFWVNVSEREQLSRFEAREKDPNKRWKITPDDWRNREKNPLYKSAIDDMFRLTHTTRAPWTVLESDDKYYARIKALRTIVSALEERLEIDPDKEL